MKPGELQCEERPLTADNKRRRCTRPGVACWVYADTGRIAKVLCNPCILRLREVGWKVRYQLEGDGDTIPKGGEQQTL